ncbi:DUF2797 domain-containing protein [Spirillospora sp. NPDC048911]|uniref:DUF2797 domain-containing protein n=1 Tax=Spirillospora sp. NPDC048911 TaxID=3364527 RepID=UPI003717BB3F
MTEFPTVWRSTGLHWESAVPLLTAIPLGRTEQRPIAEERRRPIAPGQQICWRLRGPRRCTGLWNGASRTDCPTAEVVASVGVQSQCRACAAADHGRALASDRATDHRTFALYLAWFGPDLIKVGITAAERDRDRLLEQGAIAFTLLATGSHGAIRRAERLVTGTGLAAERIGAREKADAWWILPPENERAQLVEAAYTAIHDAVAALHAGRGADHGPGLWPPGLSLASLKVVDQAIDFGLTEPPPRTYAEAAAVRDGAILAGEIKAIIGRLLLLEGPAGPLLVDMRRIAGWQFTLVPVKFIAGRPSGLLHPSALYSTSRRMPRDDRGDQKSLF